MIDEMVARNLLEKAQPRANRIKEVLDESDEFRTMEDKPLTIAAIVFAVSMAKLTGLSTTDLLSFIAYASTQITIELTKPSGEPS
jgi:hypothetical protein